MVISMAGLRGFAIRSHLRNFSPAFFSLTCVLRYSPRYRSPIFKVEHSYRRNLETFIKISRGNGAALILANQAHCFSAVDDGDATEARANILKFMLTLPVDEKHYADEKSWYAGMELFNRIAQQTAEKFNVPFVDQAAVFKGKRQLFRDEVHLIPEGTALLARMFFNEVVRQNIFTTQTKQ